MTDLTEDKAGTTIDLHTTSHYTITWKLQTHRQTDT